MEFRICTQPHLGATYRSLRAAAIATRDAGLAGFFRSDHLMAGGPPVEHTDGGGATETLTTLAALVTEVPEIRFGVLVAAATFRQPALLALGVATIDDISGGRFELGLGAGWNRNEHLANGVDFPDSMGERLGRLEEQLELLSAWWETPVGQKVSYSGRHFRLIDAPAVPKPLQRNRNGIPHIPLIIGGTGPTRTPRLAARFADEFNVPHCDLPTTIAQFERVKRACHARGRDDAEVVMSAALGFFHGQNAAEVAARTELFGGPTAAAKVGLVGSVAQIVDTLGQWGEAGTERIYFEILDLTRIGDIHLIGSEIAPQVIGS